jgi:cytochrome bd ubiquinol oxidase subunit II
MSLQITWFALVAVLIAGYGMLDGFDLGIGVAYPYLARGQDERAALRASIGPVWDGNEVWLVTGGGALFAAFPPVYAMAFSGFYMAIMLVLLGLIMRAVALEFHHRDDGRSALWDAAFHVGSILPALLFGVAVGNVVRGVPLDAHGDYAGTFWQLLNPFSLMVGVTGLAMFVAHGAAWAALKTEGSLRRRSAILRSRAQLVFVALLALTTIYAAFETRDHVRNVVTRPAGWAMLLALAAGLVAARLAMRRGRDGIVFLASAAGIVALFGIAAVGNYPAIVPARGSAAGTSLTLTGASSSHLTLTVMLVITAVGMPIVVGYTVLIYRVFRGRITADAGEY